MRNFEAELRQAMDIFSPATAPSNDELKKLDDSENDRERKSITEKTKKSLTAVLNTIKQAAEAGIPEPELKALTIIASDHEESLVNWTYNGFDEYGLTDCMEIYSGNVVEDGSTATGGRFAGIGKVIEYLAMTSEFATEAIRSSVSKFLAKDVYKPELVPSKEHSNPLARFPKRVAVPDDVEPGVRAIHEGRCEIQSTDISNPANLALDGNMLAIVGLTGYKERSPALDITPLGLTRTGWENFYEPETPSGHKNIAFGVVVDSIRRLVWTADDTRIKSIKYTLNDDRDGLKETLPTHTLDSAEYDGPIALLNSGERIIRIGRSGIALWDVDQLETHGPKGRRPIGGRHSADTYLDDSWRDLDDIDEVERSKGSLPTITRALAPDVPEAEIGHWDKSPSRPNEVMISAGRGKYTVFGLDLETGQKTSRFLGHGGIIHNIVTCWGDDRSSFVTTCGDGGVRLYDERVPVPYLTLDHSGDCGFSAVAYANVGGHPYIFTGGDRSCQVRVWDVRARTMLYKLSTGNNAVQNLGWDATNQTLYAATSCERLDRLGGLHGYRAVKVKYAREQSQSSAKEDGGESDDEDDETGEGTDQEDNDEGAVPRGPRHRNFAEFGDSDVYEEDDMGRAWPKVAWHNEESFGALFDAGSHRLIRYVFKENADPKVIPVYGDACAGDEDAFDYF